MSIFYIYKKNLLIYLPSYLSTEEYTRKEKNSNLYGSNGWIIVDTSLQRVSVKRGPSFEILTRRERNTKAQRRMKCFGRHEYPEPISMICTKYGETTSREVNGFIVVWRHYLFGFSFKHACPTCPVTISLAQLKNLHFPATNNIRYGQEKY